jgi:outer membrane lipoprotein-sorting protein
MAALVAFVSVGLPVTARCQEDDKATEQSEGTDEAETADAKDEAKATEEGAEAGRETAKETDEEIAGETLTLDPETGKPDLDRLLKYLDDLYRAESSIATMSLTVTKPRNTRTLRMKAWSKGTDRALIVIESPARDKGTATLKIGKNLWNYLPRIARKIRIPPSMMLSSWMGSDFTNDDLVRESSFLDDFDGEVVGRSEDPEGWHVNLVAKEGVVGLWEKIEYVMSLDGKIPLQAKYYDRKGRLSRVMEFTDVRDFGGRRIPARLLLTPVDKEGNQTEMVYEEMSFNVEVPERMFSLSELERKR